MRSLALFSFSLVVLFIICACASKPPRAVFGYVDKGGIEIPLELSSERTLETTDGATLVFEKKIQSNEKSSIGYNCKIRAKVLLSGPVKLFQKRIHEATAAKGVPLDTAGIRYIKSSLGKVGSGTKSFDFQLDELMGTYRLKRLGPKDLALVNNNGFYFSSFVADESELSALTLTLSLESSSADDFKNVLCSEIQRGVEFKRPAAN